MSLSMNKLMNRLVIHLIKQNLAIQSYKFKIKKSFEYQLKEKDLGHVF